MLYMWESGGNSPWIRYYECSLPADIVIPCLENLNSHSPKCLAVFYSYKNFGLNIDPLWEEILQHIWRYWGDLDIVMFHYVYVELKQDKSRIWAPRIVDNFIGCYASRLAGVKDNQAEMAKAALNGDTVAFDMLRDSVMEK